MNSYLFLLALMAPPDVTRLPDERASNFSEVAREIWELAEVGFQEERSSALLKAQLETAGFEIQSGVAGMPTAFIGSFGSGRPVAAILAEFDALPGLSQDATPERKPRASR